eukprot:6198548-Pleurochrysis_carterae.AAC.1
MIYRQRIGPRYLSTDKQRLATRLGVFLLATFERWQRTRACRLPLSYPRPTVPQWYRQSRGGDWVWRRRGHGRNAGPASGGGVGGVATQ